MHAFIVAAMVAADILAKMAAPNAGLKSYEVPVHFDVNLQSMLSLHTGLDGTAYFERPDKSAVNFKTVPMLADAFKHLTGSLGTPETWPKTYDVSVKNGGAAVNGDYQLSLVPKSSNTLASVEVDVSATTYGIDRERWTYRDGGTIDVRQQNAVVDHFLLPHEQTADFNLPSYKAHVVSDYGTYQINVSIPDSVFSP